MNKILKILIISLLFIQQLYAANVSQQEINKNNVIAFYNAAFNQLNFKSASKYIGNKYIQHSTHVADGPEGLKNFIQMLHDKFPKTHAEIKRVFIDDNYVILYVHFIMQPNTKGFATVDIFRLENGKIVEHWGVSQAIPEKLANSNGVF